MKSDLKDILRRDIAAFQTNRLATSRHIAVYKAKKQLYKLLTDPVDRKDTDLLPNEYYKYAMPVDKVINNLLGSGLLDKK
jgi:hypothetical protein